ncbi:MAG: N-acetyl-D-Glu racemase DgcA [Paraglaciecola sp.]|uniref:N-acetyl-D-Glu racemase DgcA n=1 Tax=Paraglaciecola sp. TaxID=1920173 RepID=UPI0032974C39
MKDRELHVDITEWPFKTPFRIAGKTWETLPIVNILIKQHDISGRGEAVGVTYLGETPAGIVKQIAAVACEVKSGLTRNELQYLLPAGGARNALDCALWDLEAKLSGQSVWHLTGLKSQNITTVMTIGIDDTPEAMAVKAIKAKTFPILKIKLDHELVVERIKAIRLVRPDARLCIDANQSWDLDLLKYAAPKLAELGVEMIEQPLPRNQDAVLQTYSSPLPLCADESCQHIEELPEALSMYDMINIKLDKTGGLTHALEMAKVVRNAGKRLMVGSMAGTSLGMAPAFMIGTLCDLVDIDGPLLLSQDHPNGLLFNGANVSPFSPALWG